MESRSPRRPSDSISWKSSPRSWRILSQSWASCILNHSCSSLVTAFSEAAHPAFLAAFGDGASLAVCASAKLGRQRHHRNTGETRQANELIREYLLNCKQWPKRRG